MESVASLVAAVVPRHLLEAALEAPVRALAVPTWPLISFPHTFNTCVGIRPAARREHWLYNLTMTLLACLGGTLVFSVFVHSNPFFMVNSGVLPAMVLVWWLVNFSPFDLAWRLYHVPLVRLAFQVVAALNRCRSVMAGFDKGRELYASPVGACALAVVSGLIGSLTAVWVKKLLRRADDAEVATEFSRPTWVLGSVVCATAWLYAADELRLVALGKEARAMYVVFMVCHALLEPLLGVGFVPFPLSPLLHAALAALNIPSSYEPPQLVPKKEKHA